MTSTSICYKINDTEDIQLMTMSLISLIQDITNDVRIIFQCQNDSLKDQVTLQIESKFAKLTSYTDQIVVTTEEQNDVVFIPNNSIFVEGLLQKYITSSYEQRESLMIHITKETSQQFIECINKMESSMKKSENVFIFKSESKMFTASIMHQSLMILLNLYEVIDSIQNEIQAKLNSNSEPSNDDVNAIYE